MGTWPRSDEELGKAVVTGGRIGDVEYEEGGARL